jgi:hypothetical protein
VGTWAACEQCAGFIDAEQWALMVERAVQEFMKKHHVSSQQTENLRAQFADLHAQFQSHKVIDSF